MSAPTLNAAEPHFTLYLSTNGDSLEIKKSQNQPSDKTSLELEAESCKTLQKVLTFLQKLNTSDEKAFINFYHAHNIDYPKHRGAFPKGVAHLCPLEDQIKFVMHKISEQEQGIEPRLTQLDICVLQ